MRRLLTFAVLVALALPAAAAARTLGPNDGTLSVSDGRGTVTISEPIDGDGTGPIVTGDEWSKERSLTTTTWGGTRVRFRIIGGTFKIVVKGRGINLSVVGKGNVTLNGAGTDDDGTYSVNGAGYGVLPDLPFGFFLSATTP